jgi:uroporphyrinogen decarboxylase
MAFNTSIRPVKWEFGYWGETLNTWYAEGLPRKAYPRIPAAITTPTASLYTRAWSRLRGARLPKGLPVMAGGLYWPTQGFPLDSDVRDRFGLDPTQRLVDVNLLFCPMFDFQVFEEDEQRLVYLDVDGVKRILLKEEATMPSAADWPIGGWESWRKLKAERLALQDIRQRFPPDWKELVQEYRNRDYPLALGGYPHGFFGTLANLMGYENLFVSYLQEPKLVHDILDTLTNLWIAVYAEVLSDVQVDHIQIWEDISYGSGSMIAPAMIREFLIPYIRRLTDFCRGRGISVIFLDTDGDCYDLIPLFLEAGVTGMYPFEAHCGMDIVKVRKSFPALQMMGGIPKSDIALGRAKVDRILQPVREVLQTGGYIPFGDHFIPPEVHLEGFAYYRETLNRLIDEAGKE